MLYWNEMDEAPLVLVEIFFFLFSFQILLCIGSLYLGLTYLGVEEGFLDCLPLSVDSFA